MRTEVVAAFPDGMAPPGGAAAARRRVYYRNPFSRYYRVIFSYLRMHFHQSAPHL